MKWLAYCIYRNGSAGSVDGLLGVDGCSVREIKKDNLVAAVSYIALHENSVNIATITRYHKVIDHLHRHCTVIPLRFGTAFDSEIEVEHLLETRGERYTKLLEELHGQVEMGIRVMVESRSRSGETLPRSAQEPASHPTSPGESYLASRKTHYAMESLLSDENERAINRYSAPFQRHVLKNQIRGLRGRAKQRGRESAKYFIPLFPGSKTSAGWFSTDFRTYEIVRIGQDALKRTLATIQLCAAC